MFHEIVRKRHSTVYPRLEELLILDSGRAKKRDGMTKEKRKSVSFLDRTVIGTCCCKVLQSFQPAVLSEKWNPSQVFSKDFAKILKPGSKKLSIIISQNASACVLPLLSNYYRCLWNVFFFFETAREVMQ